jgi:hypothetical protein
LPDHVARSPAIGAILMPRRAGRQLATVATAVSSETVVNVHGSLAVTALLAS